MAFDPWMLNAMEEYGYTDTNDGLINRVAVEIQRMHPKGGNVDYAEFCRICRDKSLRLKSVESPFL